MTVKTWEARTEKGITLKQLEELSGISKTALNNIENGKTSTNPVSTGSNRKGTGCKDHRLLTSKYK